MKMHSVVTGVLLAVTVVLVAYTVQAQNKTAAERREAASAIDTAIDTHARQTLENGRRVFRFDTFGSEAFWGETLQLHRAIAGAKNGGLWGREIQGSVQGKTREVRTKAAEGIRAVETQTGKVLDRGGSSLRRAEEFLQNTKEHVSGALRAAAGAVRPASPIGEA